MSFDDGHIESFFNGTASEQEVTKVLEWFQTTEGQEYLDQRFGDDVRDIKKLEKLFIDPPNPSQTFKQITSTIEKRNKPLNFIRRPRRRSSAWAVAAGLSFLIAAISVTQFFQDADSHHSEEPVSMKVYTTDQNQKVLTLSDGSKIRLNKESRIEMPESFENYDRTVKLNGEAFFEIAHNPQKPFLVHTGSAEVRVLGTSFSVKTNSPKNDIYVAVSEGRVLLASSFEGQDAQNEVLEKDMMGIYDAEMHTITREETDINNYLSWMSGRIIYDKMPFSQVAKELERIYGIDCEIKDEAVLDMKLTSNFSEISLENVLEVIAEGLEIQYEQNDDVITWALKGDA
ncbi:MAG: FecR domain-containing protein [Balneolales bacterium]